MRICYTGSVPDQYIITQSGVQPLYLDNGIPAAGSRLLQEKYRRDFASHRTADERTNGVDRSLTRGIEEQKEVYHIHRSKKENRQAAATA